MKRLHRYILSSFIGPFFVTFFICIFVLLMQFLWKYLDELVGKGLEFSIIAELMLYAMSHLVPLALPLSMLLASIMTFGNLGESNELLAMKAAGISLTRIMRSLIILGTFISVFAFYFSTELLPITNKKFGALLWSIRSQRPEMSIKEGMFSNDIDNFAIRVGHKDKSGKVLYDIMIYDHRNGQANVYVTVADSGIMEITDDKKYMIMTLFDGESYHDEKSKTRKRKKEYPLRWEKFSKETIITQLRNMDFERKDENSFSTNYKAMPMKQLVHDADSLSRDLDKRQSNYSTKMNYLSSLTRKVVSLSQPDSLRKKPEIEETVYIDIDSIVGNMSRKVKLDIISHALRDARTNQRSISEAKENLKITSKWRNKFWIEWHRKYTLSVACLIFFFIGAPLGAIIRKGGLGMPLIISVVLFIFYYIVSMTGEKFSREGVSAIWEGMWFSTFVFLPAGIFLTYKAANDSVILNIDSYIALLKKLVPFKKKAKETEAKK